MRRSDALEPFILREEPPTGWTDDAAADGPELPLDAGGLPGDQDEAEPLLTTALEAPAPPDIAEPPPLDPSLATTLDEAVPPYRSRMPSFALFASVAVHLAPLLLLVPWGGEPVETPPPIPVQLVLAAPPPPAPPPPAPSTPHPPPRGPLASEDFGTPPATPEPPPQAASEPAEPPRQIAAVPPAPAPPAAAPSPDPVPPPPPLPPEAAPVPPPKPPPPVRPAVHKPAPPHRTIPHEWVVLHDARVPGPPATRDEYLAYLVMLTRRHLGLLPLDFVAGRRGETVLGIKVLDNGTIARISVEHSSGYPDIDERVERMVAAVGHFPPLPQWFQGDSMLLNLRLRFPEALEVQ